MRTKGKTKAKVPVIYRSDLMRDLGNAGEIVWPGESWVIAFTGIRGAGKSLAMAYAIVVALIKGLTVWSNMQVRFKLVIAPGKARVYETLPLDWDAVYRLERSIQKGVVAIDELQYFMDSRQSLGMGNRLLGAVINQIRKRKLDFYYTVKALEWVDKRLRYWETDIEVRCWDKSKGHSNIPKGHHFLWKVFDISGAWTGHMWYPGMPPTHICELKKADRLWPVYSTEAIIDYLDAMAPIKLNMEKRVIGDKEDNKRLRLETYASIIRDLKNQGTTEIQTDQLQVLITDAGIDQDPRRIGQELVTLGVTRKRSRQSGSSYVYLLPDNGLKG